MSNSIKKWQPNSALPALTQIVQRTIKQSRAQFNYKIGEWSGIKLLMIVDKNQEATSVTNDIENVVADIAQWENIDPKLYFIAYKDTDGNWDGWDAATQSFFFFRHSPAYKVLGEAENELTY